MIIIDGVISNKDEIRTDVEGDNNIQYSTNGEKTI